MANLQQTLDALQPYVIGIRYVDKVPVIDAVFKDGWTLPDSDIITKVKGNQDLNYFMIYSDKDGVGLDELLAYIDTTIKANIEREKKHELLKEKVNELKELFKRTTLLKLKRLKFAFNDEDLLPEINEFDLDDTNEPENIKQEPIVTEQINVPQPPPESSFALTEEDMEILEEEKRAENFKQMQEAKKLNGQVKKLSSKVELPPKKVLQPNNDEYEEFDCNCGPEEACEKCIDRKGF